MNSRADAWGYGAGDVISISAVVFCQSGSSYINFFVLSGAFKSTESFAPIVGSLKLNDPTASSSERDVLAQSRCGC